jgi:hypothetical protein
MSQKNRTFAFFGEKVSKFFQKSPIGGIFMRFLKKIENLSPKNSKVQ